MWSFLRPACIIPGFRSIFCSLCYLQLQFLSEHSRLLMLLVMLFVLTVWKPERVPLLLELMGIPPDTPCRKEPPVSPVLVFRSLSWSWLVFRPPLVLKSNEFFEFSEFSQHEQFCKLPTSDEPLVAFRLWAPARAEVFESFAC